MIEIRPGGFIMIFLMVIMIIIQIIKIMNPPYNEECISIILLSVIVMINQVGRKK